jgi:hypothetical protein
MIERGLFVPVKRNVLIGCTDLEIVSICNAELRGKCNYYGMASNFYKLNYLAYLAQYSCLKTLAAKHKCSISKVMWKFKDGRGGWGIRYETRGGRRRMYFAKYVESKQVKGAVDVMDNALMIYGFSTTTFESRLKARVCELCGASEGDRYEVHHVNKVMNLGGKTFWERVMIAKRRKTLVVCKVCHYKIHNP